MEPLTALQSGMSRRDLLKSAAAMGLSFAIPTLSSRAADKRGSERRMSLIVLWLAGGPSQLETWDPHPGTKIGGPTKDIATKVPGLRIADMYPQTAEQIHSLSVIRSLVSLEGDHERGAYFVKTGYRPDPTVVHPSLTAVVAHQLTNKQLEIPAHISFGGGQFPARGGYLGAEYDAFRIYEPGRSVHNMSSGVNKERHDRRIDNLGVVSRAFLKGRRIQTENTLHQFTVERALRMMKSEQLNAFDLDKQVKAFQIEKETKELRKAYGGNRFGLGCLVARRLVETGVQAIEVTLNGWDTHFNNFEGHKKNADILDPAFATLIKDLRERDLLDSTVVLCIGEFGRDPTISGYGRDHWPSGFSCVIGGGGIKSGLVIGATDPTFVKKKPTDEVKITDLSATLLNVMGVEHEKELITPIGRPLALSTGTPIKRLFESA